MRSIRKLGLVGLSALMLALAGASAASADILETTSGHVATGTGISGTSTNTHLVGTFFGFPQTIDCTHSVVSGTATQTTTAGQPVKGNITSISFTGCTNTNNNNASCTVTSNASAANPAGLSVDNTGAAINATIQLANWSGASTVSVTVANCLLGGASCAYTGSGSPNHTIPGTFNNTTSNLNIPAASNNVTGACGSGKWTGDYVVKTSGGLLLKVTNS